MRSIRNSDGARIEVVGVRPGDWERTLSAVSLSGLASTEHKRHVVNGTHCDKTHFYLHGELVLIGAWWMNWCICWEYGKTCWTKAKVLAAVAESEAESRVALECLRLASQCEKLDGAIEAFTNRVLESQAPKGTG